MTISDFLNLPNFADLKLLAGKNGLGREIANVTVVDTPDGTNWLSGGEFVITTAYMLHEEQDLLDFLQILHEKKTAGVGVKENRYITTIPNTALKLSDKLNLPLISVPESYPFVDIINPVLTQIIDQQSLLLTQANMIHKEFLGLAINNNSVPEILRTLNDITRIPCAFMDTHFQEIYFSDETSTLMPKLQDADIENINGDFLKQYDYYVVANKNEQFGYLLFEKGCLETMKNDSIRTALEYASIVLILRIQVRIANRQMAEKYKASFLEDLLTNNVKTDVEIHNRARLYGWDFANGGLTAVVDINNIKKYFTDRLDSNTNRMLEEATEIIFRHSIREMHQMFPKAKYFRQSDLIAFIISMPSDSRDTLPDHLEQTFKRLQSSLSRVSPFTVTLGIGQYYDNIRDISKSYSEARVAINLGYSLQWFDRILFYNRLGLYRLLAPVMNSPESEELCMQYIRPLEEYDRKYHGELLSTLKEILQNGWNLKESAEGLYIHYNSVKYRYSKICKVLNLDLADHNNRSLVEIAMKLYLLKHKPGNN